MHWEDLGFHNDREAESKPGIFKIVLTVVRRTDCKGQRGSRKVRQEALGPPGVKRRWLRPGSGGREERDGCI